MKIRANVPVTLGLLALASACSDGDAGGHVDDNGLTTGSSVASTGESGGTGLTASSTATTGESTTNGNTSAPGPTTGGVTTTSGGGFSTGTSGTGSTTTGVGVTGTAADGGMTTGSTGEGTDDAGASGASVGKLPRVETTEGMGPFDGVVKVKDTPPGGWLIYPEDIGRDGIKHPLFVFGPGGGTTPDTYDMRGMHWDMYGSYGFVIYVLPRSTGDGSAMKAGLDWLIEQNDDSQSPLYQHLDTSRVAAAGHSMGSVTTFDFMPDDRVTTTIHISGGSFDGLGPSQLSKDTMFLCGPSQGADTAFPQCEGDFENSEVPTFYTNIEGSDHLTSGRLGWPSVIAWLLWHLADQEDQWKKEFLEPGGKFQTGVYKSQIKNW